MRGCGLLLTLFVTSLSSGQGETTLGLEGTHFTVNGRSTFLLGISYYGGLGASQDFVRRDLDDLQRHLWKGSRGTAIGISTLATSAMFAMGDMSP